MRGYPEWIIEVPAQEGAGRLFNEILGGSTTVDAPAFFGVLARCVNTPQVKVKVLEVCRRFPVYNV